MAPEKPLPYSDAFSNTEEYVESLLDLVGSHELLRTLCGGVHILDFFTTDPPLYSQLLPQEWRGFFAQHDIMDLLDLFMRNDIDVASGTEGHGHLWRNGPCPPESLLDYIKLVRKHLLDRDLETSQCTRNRTQKKLCRDVSIGMNVKKVHEVGLFASYIDSLASDVSASMPIGQSISHFVDFGSGQSYLGRALASEPYNKQIVAIESKAHNSERAKDLDIKSKLVEKPKMIRNKKAFREGLISPDHKVPPTELPTPPPEPDGIQGQGPEQSAIPSSIEVLGESKGSIQHVSHRILSGDLTDVVSRISGQHRNKRLMVMSLHSCGNLVHHGLRSLVLNPSVKAVAMIGCCYNLITERLGPATYKHPDLRPENNSLARAQEDGEACDPNGFPMSERLCTYGKDGQGISLNITARMMAVQAPQNWGPKDSSSFFKRHFYRALLQRIFLARGVVGPPSAENFNGSALGHSSGGTPIIIGSLTKGCYNNFVAYVRGALAKLYVSADWGYAMREKMREITDAEIVAYEESYRDRQKELSVTWSLMAFSAGVVEAAIVVDRWLWLKEQEEVREAWVESVFDYRLSPRNLVVVGVKS